MNIDLENTVCERVGVKPKIPDGDAKLGIAISTIGLQPINGLRHNEENGTCGWYIWCGTEFSENDDFFSPLHVQHVSEYLPQIKKYLSLPPGYRFLIDNSGYEDIWFYQELLIT